MKENVIHVAICDDNLQILEEIEKYIKGQKDICDLRISTYSNPLKLLKQLEQGGIDILLLDIDMPYVNGMEIAKQILEKHLQILVIFLTCQESMVYDSFQYRPFSFIRKSMYKQELKDTLLRAIKHLSKNILVLQQGSELQKIDLSEILYIEADGNYVKLVTKKKTIRQRDTISGMEHELSSKGFVRVHKGFLVNQEAVYRLNSDKVILVNEEEIPIGRSMSKEAKSALMKGFRI